ncbi:MAG TPA: SGNH/GDSL hydrolase family protein [Ideonella sp.]|nr:SGNH/GDSL hydrolase family protein [Ideonella sp.]
MARTATTPVVSLAVLGDSDSESYRGTAERGGRFHDRTLQWTEVLGRLRPDQLDLGPWGDWGWPGKIVALQRWLGLEVHGRAPRKFDYLYNFAIGGATCDELMGGSSHQARQLVSLMDRDPARWRSGVVVIRIGVNSFGKADSLDQLAKDPAAPAVAATMAHCAQQVREAVALIHATHAETRVVVVGIFDNSHWPRYLERWQSAQELRNIASGLDQFDRVLRGMAEADARIAFFDDRAWFARRWGGRAEDGRPAYRTLPVGQRLQVTNTAGDEPHNAVVADGHAGVVWNTLWAQSLVDFLHRRFGMNLRPITEMEAEGFLASIGVSGGATR